LKLDCNYSRQVLKNYLVNKLNELSKKVINSDNPEQYTEAIKILNEIIEICDTRKRY